MELREKLENYETVLDNCLKVIEYQKVCIKEYESLTVDPTDKQTSTYNWRVERLKINKAIAFRLIKRIEELNKEHIEQLKTRVINTTK